MLLFPIRPFFVRRLLLPPLSARISFSSASVAGHHVSDPEVDDISGDVSKVVRIVSTSVPPHSDLAAALDASGIAVSSPLVSQVLKRLSNAGVLALAFFRWAELKPGFCPTSAAFHELIDSLGKIKQFRIVWSLVDAMKSYRLLSSDTFAIVIRRYARAGKIKDAFAVFDKMTHYGLTQSLPDHNRLLDTLCKSRNVAAAHDHFNQMKRKKKPALMPDLKTYTILLEGWGLERNFDMVRSVHDEMLDAGFEPDVVTYGILINAFCRAGKCDEAVMVFAGMESAGCPPSPHIFCTLINGFGNEQRLDEALKYFELSKAAVGSAQPELPTYNAVVGAYCRSSKFADAFRTVEEMRACGVGPNARTYDIIIHHLIKAGEAEEAYRVFLQMMDGGSGGCEPELNTYTMVVGMLCTKERTDMAEWVWKEMRKRGVMPCMHMFASLVRALCAEGKVETACRYFEEMLAAGIRPPGQMFAGLKDSLIDAGRKDIALVMAAKLHHIRNSPLHI